jgi:dynein assembly factor 1, axonemal
MEMSKDTLKKLCKQAGLYGMPSLNDKLYLHYKGFSKIQNLEEYVGLRALWLEGNGLSSIEGLETLVELRTLYLHENAIEFIGGLDTLVELDCLNLSKNFIKRIENLGSLRKLSSLNLANNCLSSFQSIENLLECSALQAIDLQHNKIDDPRIVEIFQQFSDLRVLYLQGNPVVKLIPHYRKTIISKCRLLKYLDDRPVFDDERRRVDAWAAAFEIGGIDEANEAERAEIKKIRKEKDEADERNMEAFSKMMQEGMAIRRARERQELSGAAMSPLSAYVSRGEEEGVNPFSGETIIQLKESDSVFRMREHLWGSDTHPENAVCEVDKENNSTNLVAGVSVDSGSLFENRDNDIWTKLKIESDGIDENCTEFINNEDSESVEMPEDNQKTTRFMSRLSDAMADVSRDVTVLQQSQASSSHEVEITLTADELASLD